MEPKELKVGDLFADKDPDRFGRQYRVACILTKEAHAVREDVAICVSRGKAASVKVRRLLHPSRFDRIDDSVVDAEVYLGEAANISTPPPAGTPKEGA